MSLQCIFTSVFCAGTTWSSTFFPMCRNPFLITLMPSSSFFSPLCYHYSLERGKRKNSHHSLSAPGHIPRPPPPSTLLSGLRKDPVASPCCLLSGTRIAMALPPSFRAILPALLASQSQKKENTLTSWTWPGFQNNQASLTFKETSSLWLPRSDVQLQGLLKLCLTFPGDLGLSQQATSLTAGQVFCHLLPVVPGVWTVG